MARADHTSVPPELFVAVALTIERAPEDLIEKVRRGVVKHGLNHAYAAPPRSSPGAAEARARRRRRRSPTWSRTRARRAASVKAAASRRANQDAAALSRALLTHAPEYALPYLVFFPRAPPVAARRRDGEANGGAAYRPFQYAASALVAALTTGTSGESVPAACKILRKLKFAADAVDEGRTRGAHVLADIALLVLHKEATRRGWDTGAFPGQVAFPRAYFTLQQTSATNGSGAEGARARAGTTATCRPGSR